MRSSNGRKYLCTCVWPILKVNPLANAAPNGILSNSPPYTPGMDTVPALRQAMIAWRKTLGRSVPRNVAVLIRS